MPLVSIILVTKGRPEWLRQAVASVVAQTFEDWECLVVDNHHLPNSTTTLPWYGKVRYMIGDNPTNIGVSRNTGARSTESPFLLFLDDDDTLLPNALESLLCPLQQRPELVGSYGLPYLMNANGERVSEAIDNRPPGLFLHLSDLAGNMNMLTPPGCALIRRSAFEKAGGWDESGEVRESVELFFRLLKLGPMQCVPQAVIGYRQHDGQLSRQRNQNKAEYARTEAKLQECLQEVYG